MSNMEGIRYDKYLWTVRLFKTRSMASDACRNGRVQIDGLNIKPSRTAVIEDIFTLRRQPALLNFRVKELPPSRVGAKLVSQYLEDLTPEEEREKLNIKLSDKTGLRPRGTGRPTKRERRDLDRLRDR
ncbi:MAG: RNA-binding S4 domain-containing protein [Bacteroidales bacterium]|nr:RNA-binding S4 domain-containing protein [Bacteroidales bacterium]